MSEFPPDTPTPPSHPDSITVGTPPHAVEYVQRTDQVHVVFLEGTSDETMDEVLREAEPVRGPAADCFGMRARLRGARKDWVVKPERFETPRQYARSLLEHPQVRIAAPVYVPADGEKDAEASAPNPAELYVKFTDGVVARERTRDLLGKIEGFGYVRDAGRSDLLDPVHKFDISGRLADDGFELLEEVASLRGVEWAETGWLKLDPLEQAPPHEHWPRQWNLRAIGFPDAWDRSTGAGVKVAVIDTGFDFEHPDLQGRYDRTSELGFKDGKETKDASVDKDAPSATQSSNETQWHGTAVAGVIAGSMAAERGVVGIAGGCQIVPIKVDPGDAGQIAAGIKHALKVGARVANLSLSLTQMGTLSQAITDSWNSGRMVVCAASGNGVDLTTQAVAFPAEHANVIAVGACDKTCQRRKTKQSRDGEQWLSRYGEKLDVVAPGVWVPTTDVGGGRGYNRGMQKTGTMEGVEWFFRRYRPEESGDTNGTYLFLFTGTSAAVAQVSGLAALLVSARPALSNRQVRKLIESTCKKISPVAPAAPYKYRDHGAVRPNGTWHHEVGYGLIDCEAALARVDDKDL